MRAHRAQREIPERTSDRLLLATWNVANLGAPEQRRDPECFKLLAEIVGWFDLVAVQEVRDNADAGIRPLLAELTDSWRLVFSEAGGNDERFAFLWDSDKVELGQLVGKATLEPAELERAGGPGFQGFSRTPYLGTLHCNGLRIEIISVHSFFGEEGSAEDMERRLAETQEIGWWCEERSEDPDSYTKDILAMGDFNTPSESDSELAERMLDGLRQHGLHTPEHTTQLGTAVRSENHYDQLLFFPKDTGTDLVADGVFDFDTVIFHDLWEERIAQNGQHQGVIDFHNYAVWAISDHRPMWAQLRTA